MLNAASLRCVIKDSRTQSSTSLCPRSSIAVIEMRLLVFVLLACVLTIEGAKFTPRILGTRRYGFNRFKNQNFVGREDPDKEVALVHVLFRHGHRTPADTYPNDPYVNETFHP
uniref:Uncharacterized protein n=2 Tax=Lutzomyia longipalpis TaxID=7200 RepID=A0A1B0CHJ3_LUTLO